MVWKLEFLVTREARGKDAMSFKVPSSFPSHGDIPAIKDQSICFGCGNIQSGFSNGLK